MSLQPRKSRNFVTRRAEQLESRNLLSGHAIASFFASPNYFSSSSHQSSGFAGANMAAHNQVFGSYAIHSHNSGSQTGGLSAALTDPNGGTGTATVGYQATTVGGVAEAVFTVTGDTTAAGTSVALAIGGTTVGNVTLDSSGAGTLTVPASSITTLPTAGSAITLGSLAGTFANSTGTNPGHGGGCEGGGGSESTAAFSASLTDPNGGTGTAAVTYQTGNLFGVSAGVLKVSGDTTAAGTSVAVTVNGTAVGNVTLDSSGAGTLLVPGSTLSSAVAAGSTVTVGTLGGAFAATTIGGTNSQTTRLSGPLTDPNSTAITGNAAYETSTNETEFKVRVSGAAASSTLSVAIGGTVVGQLTTDATGAGVLVLSSNPHGSELALPAGFPTSVTTSTTVTVGTLSGTLSTSTTLSGHGRRGWGHH